VLLSLAPVTQVVAQAEQPGRQSQASQTASSENSDPVAPHGEERDAALPNSRLAEADTVQLLRLETTVFFPGTDSDPLFDSTAATPATDAASTTDTVLTVVLVAAVLTLFVLGFSWDHLGGV